MDPEHLLSKSIYQLLRSESFFAHVLANVTRVITPDIPTMAVSFREDVFYLYVNPDFLANTLSIEQRVAILKHEVLHLVFKHLFRSRGKERVLENLAADLVVNQYVDPWPLPEGAILLSTFPELALRPVESMEYYYNELLKLREPDAEQRYPQSCRALTTVEEGDLLVGSHELWGQGGAGASERILGRILSDSKKRSPGYGLLPSEVRRSIDQLLRVPKISWKHVLRLFSASCGRTVIRTTRRKESKRFDGNPGRRIKRLRKLIVAVDTSGSIDDKLLAEFWTEIVSIYKTGTSVTVLTCDATIHEVYELKRSLSSPTFKGGGGTSFNPVIEWANKSRGYNGLIYFTDGYAPEPDRCKMPILWCVYGGLQKTSHLKGKVIHLGDESESDFPF
jgi:predicted metal-dependent peptidase